MLRGLKKQLLKAAATIRDHDSVSSDRDLARSVQDRKAWYAVVGGEYVASRAEDGCGEALAFSFDGNVRKFIDGSHGRKPLGGPACSKRGKGGERDSLLDNSRDRQGSAPKDRLGVLMLGSSM